ncbi:MAG: GNAT family N-acetyltransferase [Vicinamibacterales bacterium]
MSLQIRPATADDADAQWAICVSCSPPAGPCLAVRCDARTSAGAATPPGGWTFVALADEPPRREHLLPQGQFPGAGRRGQLRLHGGARARGLGVGDAWPRHSLDEARGARLRAVQFNAVVNTNTGAIRLWERCGFAIVGTVPAAFRHPTQGEVAVHVMHRRL